MESFFWRSFSSGSSPLEIPEKQYFVFVGGVLRPCAFGGFFSKIPFACDPPLTLVAPTLCCPPVTRTRLLSAFCCIENPPVPFSFRSRGPESPFFLESPFLPLDGKAVIMVPYPSFTESRLFFPFGDSLASSRVAPFPRPGLFPPPPPFFSADSRSSCQKLKPVPTVLFFLSV